MNHKVVAIGASAGGLEALESFFQAVPHSAGVSFFVIQHLSPDHESMMAELLAGHCKLPVLEAEDGQILEPDRVYLSPPGFVPIAVGHKVSLAPRSPEATLILPINVYFESLAKTLGGQAIAVILSGTGSDGTEGAKQIRACGGQVYAQSPGAAAFSGMPQSVISADVLCGVADAGELWPLIASRHSAGQLSEALTEDMAVETDKGTADESEPNVEFHDLFEYLRELFDVDFSDYQFGSIARRVRRRMSLLAIPTLADYLAYLKDVEDETRALHHDLFIGVTEFFRDKDAYALLGSKVMEPLLNKAADGNVRIWSAGCASGEEAYSLYILASETSRKLGYTGKIQVFATDVSKGWIDEASRGCFTEERMEGLGEELRARYFDQIAPSAFKVKPEVRAGVVFAQHNFMVDPPFTNMDLVSCRNVLIYLAPKAQEVALRAFSYALREEGYLFLGASESLGKFGAWYQPVAQRERIFQRSTAALDPKLWVQPKSKGRQQPIDLLNAAQTRLQSVTISKNLLSVYDKLLGRFSIDAFLISAEQEILHLFGNAADYCINQQGRLSTDLPSQLDKNFRLTLIALTHKALESGKRVSAHHLEGKSRDGACTVNLSVEPQEDVRGKASILLVEIVKCPEVKRASTGQSDAGEGDRSGDSERLDRYQLLEQDLRYTKENLEASNEELQVSNEELQTLAEEVQVANEELQSTNEELHSTNEELTSLNAEYERKNHELVELNASHDKLLQSTEDGVLYVDGEMSIRRFNHAIAKAFHLLPSDVGRSLTHIAYKLDKVDELIEDVRGVLAGGERIERESIELEGRRYMKRVVPYRGIGDVIEGALLTFTDITEISTLNQRFELAVQAAHMSWWDWDLVSGALSVFSAGECLLGEGCLDVSRDREGWLSQVHPDDMERVSASLDKHLAGESEEWICEHRFMTVSGAWLWVSNRGQVTRRSEAGEALEMMGTTQDIDNYKKALIESNYQRDIMDAAGSIALLGAWECDVDTKVLRWSEQIYSIMGVDEDFDPSVEYGFQFFPEKDRAILKEAFEKAVQQGIPYDLELECIDRNGNHLITRALGCPQIDHNGQVFKVVGVFQDVTKVFKTEREMQAYFSMSPDFQATLDLAGRFKTFSPSWSAVLGYPSDKLEAMPLQQMVHPDDRDEFNQKLAGVLQGGTASSYETRVLNYQSATSPVLDQEIWMSWSMACDERLELIFISARCVTEQRQAKQKLKEALFRAEEANRAKTDFLAMMSHELRTPLNPILGFSELLLDEVESEEHKELIKTIVDSGAHLIDLIDDILDYSRVGAGKMEVQPVPFSIEDLLEEKIRHMRGRLEGKSLEFRYVLDEAPFEPAALPRFVGDVSILKHILRNLIANAIKFTEEGHVLLKVRFDSAAEGKALVVFEVEDTGIGIEPAMQETIFEAFTQADSSMTRNYGGTGLGLAICKRLVDLMEGAISVTSEQGKGSCFRVEVPLGYLPEKNSADPVEMAKDVKEPDAVIRPDTTALAAKRTILVVEDNLSNQYFLKELLSRVGIEPVMASNGEDALEIFTSGESQFGAILLDLHMPGMGGVNTLKAIREFEKNSGADPIPVFILTADVQESTREVCFANGATDFIAKPVAVDLLRRTLLGLKTD